MSLQSNKNRIKVYFEEGLDNLAHDEDLISLAGSEIAGAYNLTLNQMESAAEEVSIGPKVDGHTKVGGLKSNRNIAECVI